MKITIQLTKPHIKSVEVSCTKAAIELLHRQEISLLEVEEYLKRIMKEEIACPHCWTTHKVFMNQKLLFCR